MNKSAHSAKPYPPLTESSVSVAEQSSLLGPQQVNTKPTNGMLMQLLFMLLSVVQQKHNISSSL